MNNLERIKTIDDQLKILDKLIDSGNYLAAGIELSIHVGQREGDETPDLPKVELGFGTNLTALLTLVHDGLREARAFRVRLAHEEWSRLNAFFASEVA